eukprot:m.414582 g.414582  ORF g.414582 m.414582 type:complete len:83 (-) comp21272_c0_seq1:2309-2557(-)
MVLKFDVGFVASFFKHVITPTTPIVLPPILPACVPYNGPNNTAPSTRENRVSTPSTRQRQVTQWNTRNQQSFSVLWLSHVVL